MQFGYYDKMKSWMSTRQCLTLSCHPSQKYDYSEDDNDLILSIFKTFASKLSTILSLVSTGAQKPSPNNDKKTPWVFTLKVQVSFSEMKSVQNMKVICIETQQVNALLIGAREL